MPGSFTYGNYPHIFDAFVADTSFQAQLALRLTCKSFRNAVDRLHMHHLVLTPHGSDSVNVTGTHHRIPAMRLLKPKAWRKNPQLELTSHTRIVDVRGFFPPTCNLARLRKAFPSLDVLRMCTSLGEPQTYTPYIPFAAKTLVLFTSPNGGDCNPALYGVWDDEEDDEPEVVPKGVTGKLPESVTKIVVNMGGSDVPIADMFHFVLDPPKHVKQIDIIVPRCTKHSSGCDVACLSEHILAMDTAELIGAPHVKYLLVGLDVVAPGYDMHFVNVLRAHVSQWRFSDVDYGKGSEAERDPVAALFPGAGEATQAGLIPKPITTQESELRAEGTGEHKDQENKEDQQPKPPKMTHKDKVDSILSQVETLSVTEYRECLGHSQAALQSIEYMDYTEIFRGFGRMDQGPNMEQLPNLATPGMAEALMDYLAEGHEPSDALLDAMVELEDDMDPYGEMEDAMAEFMDEAAGHTPEVMAAYMQEALAAGLFQSLIGGVSAGAGPGAAIEESGDDEGDLGEAEGLVTEQEQGLSKEEQVKNTQEKGAMKEGKKKGKKQKKKVKKEGKKQMKESKEAKKEETKPMAS